MSQPLHAVIFDLDGTLLDSEPDIRHALNQTLRKHGRRDITREEVVQIVGDGLRPTLHRALAATGGPIAVSERYDPFQDFVTFYSQQKPDSSQIYPHVVEVLTSLKSRNIKLGLCTNKQEDATLRLLQQLDMLGFFAFIAGGDTFPVHKPHPGHVLGVMDQLAVQAPHVVMVGDSSNDVRAAQSAGIPCIAVTHGYEKNIASLGAEQMITGFDHLLKALIDLNFS